MTKKLNIDQIQSELRGGSAFFPGYKRSESPTPPVEEHKKKMPPEESGHKDTQPVVKSTNHQGEPSGVPPPVRGTVSPTLPLIPKVRRPIKQRQPFDVFEDLSSPLTGGAKCGTVCVRRAAATCTTTTATYQPHEVRHGQNGISPSGTPGPLRTQKHV